MSIFHSTLQLLSTLRQISILHQPHLDVFFIPLQPTRLGLHRVEGLFQSAVEALERYKMLVSLDVCIHMTLKGWMLTCEGGS